MYSREQAGIRFKMRQEEMALAMYLTVAAGDPTDAASWTNSALVRLKLSRDDEDDENTMTKCVHFFTLPFCASFCVLSSLC